MSSTYPPPQAPPEPGPPEELPPEYRAAEPPPPRRRRGLSPAFKIAFTVLASYVLGAWAYAAQGLSLAVPMALAPPLIYTTREPARNVVLFVTTCMTTYLAGGPVFAAALMAILLTHEMGHYLTSKVHHLRASLPYFIPMPLNILGTMGAVIISRSPFPTRRELFDVGIAGPIAGFIVAVPVWIVGMALSTVAPQTVEPGTLSFVFGDSLLTWITQQLMYPDLPADAVIMAHPLAIAGWAGLFVTGLNLIPAGSLDGGHVSYAISGHRHEQVSRLVVLVLLVLGFTTSYLWLFFAALVALFGLRHPAPLFPHVGLTRGRRWTALLGLVIFLLTFMPDPLRGEFHEPEPQHHPPSELQRLPGPGGGPGRGRTLDVHATPELRVALRFGAP